MYNFHEAVSEKANDAHLAPWGEGLEVQREIRMCGDCDEPFAMFQRLGDTGPMLCSLCGSEG